MKLEGQTALVTGAGRGIGRAIALAFAEAGCHVAAAARSREEIDATAEAVRATGRRALSLPCDVADPAAVQATVDATLDTFGAIDILVNNAGYACFKPFETLTLTEWQRTIDVNLTGVFLCCQAVLPSMKARRAGRIINISSVSALKPIIRQSAYCASKFGLNGLSKCLALELREYNIAVHALCPGGVDTKLAQDAMPERDKADWMTPEDIAHTALYLATLSPRTAVDVVHVRRFHGTPL